MAVLPAIAAFLTFPAGASSAANAGPPSLAPPVAAPTGTTVTPRAAFAASPAPSTASGPAPGAGCLASGNGFLRAQIRGAVELDIHWRNAELTCEGSPRPDGSGVRLAFAGPLHGDGRRVRLVFGVGAVSEGASGRALPTNLTVIFEGEQRLFATRGDANCMVDELRQERQGQLGGPVRSYRVIARGFCIGPASALGGAERILVTRFDFAGRASFEDGAAAAAAERPQ